MQIRQLDPSSSADVRRFNRFPFALYRDCPQWVPMMGGEARRVFDQARNPFYRHSQAAFFMVESGRTSLGRVAAIHNRRYTEYSGRKAASFYFFDAVDDAEVGGRPCSMLCSPGRTGQRVERGDRSQRNVARRWAGVVGGRIRASGRHRHPVQPPVLRAADAPGAGFEKEVDYLPATCIAASSWRSVSTMRPRRIRERRGFTIARFTSKDDLRRRIPAIGKHL